MFGIKIPFFESVDSIYAETIYAEKFASFLNHGCFLKDLHLDVLCFGVRPPCPRKATVTVRSRNQHSAYIAVYIDCEDLTATILTKRARIKKTYYT